ncbi:MAG: hypothetical protein EOM87_00620 [Clostridia bacterium]|nr:hypothetical protein [Clostridia bacterium]
MGKRCFTCCIVIFIIAAVIVGALGFAVAYVPGATKLVEKFTSQGLIAVYVGADGETAGTDAGFQTAAAILLASYTSTYPDVTFEGIVIFLSETEGAEEPEIIGYIVYTDSIKSAALMVAKFYQENGEPSSIDSPEGTDIHASLRGKAYFIGNMSAEIAFRKIIF